MEDVEKDEGQSGWSACHLRRLRGQRSIHADRSACGGWGVTDFRFTDGPRHGQSALVSHRTRVSSEGDQVALIFCISPSLSFVCTQHIILDALWRTGIPWLQSGCPRRRNGHCQCVATSHCFIGLAGNDGAGALRSNTRCNCGRPEQGHNVSAFCSY